VERDRKRSPGGEQGEGQGERIGKGRTGEGKGRARREGQGEQGRGGQGGRAEGELFFQYLNFLQLFVTLLKELL
jgi:hypothetical protein